MKRNFPLAFILAIVFFIISCSPPKSIKSGLTKPYSPPSEELYRIIAQMDSIMFDAFNQHDLTKLQSLFSEDLEFYHDKAGFADFKQTMENFRLLFEKNQNTGMRRELVKGSLEVYPVNEYGAIEICLHRFCHMENGKEDCGVFKNTMIRQKKNGQWKVTRVISYDHYFKYRLE